MEVNQNRRLYPLGVIGVLFLAFSLRIAAAFLWQSALDNSSERFRFGDSDTYWVLAERIANGEAYEYGGKDSRAFRAPGYPLLLAPLILIGGEHAIILARLAGAFLGTISVALLMFATFELAKLGNATDRACKIASLFCGVMASLYLGAIGMSIFILSESIFCPLMILSLTAWNRSELHSNSKYRFTWGLTAGAATGAACLCRPSWLLWPVLMGLMAISRSYSRVYPEAKLGKFNKRPAIASALVSLTVFALGSAIVMTPWWIRNYIVFQAFVPTTLQVGASLYDGLHDGASGASDEGMNFTLETENDLREFDREWHIRHPVSDSNGDRNVRDQGNASEPDYPKVTAAPPKNDSAQYASEFGDLESDKLVPFEIRLNRILFRKAIAWVFENPYATMRLALVKFVKMWTPWPTAKEVGGRGVQAAEALGYLAIVGFALLGFYMMKPEMRYSAMIYASPVFYFAGLHTIFVGSVRYRQPAILVLTIVSGIGAAWMLDQIEWKRKRLT